ncbi:site-specific integrase [Oxalobacter vibrioformis]|uniref:Site-specific integrase n=1 Tax=Oxalobacter vibrioformis TaxID=933080 RepID=A0A9E9LWL0_9BURK|nr:site-specific integrase [Oxalobacter vibrioformis]WAW10022.1 site-specific integrase [Oxalobacter vibrioformis]
MLIRRNGIWWVDTTLPCGKRIRKSLKTRNRGEATLRVPEALREEVSSGPAVSLEEPLKPRTVSLREAFIRCMREREQWRTSKSPKTLEGNFRALAAYFGEHADLSEIPRPRAVDYVEWLRETNPDISPSTVNQRLSLLSVLIEAAAYNWGHPLSPYKMPRAKPRQGRKRILNKQEEENLLAYFQDNYRMRKLVECLLDTGCRLSEMLELDVNKDVKWEWNMLFIWKNKADSPKQIPMTERVLKALRETPRGAKNPFEGLTVHSADKHFAKAREALGFQDDKEFVLHALRHTVASRLAAKGVDAFKIQAFMGHRNIQTTQQYVTLYGEHLKDLPQVIEGY